jgi:hypothetical protein
MKFCDSKSNKSEECLLECYVDRAGLVKNGKIDKKGLMVIYNYENWAEVISKGADSCAYEAEGPLVPRFMKFFNCLDDFMIENCANFHQSEECARTKCVHENCTHAELNCSIKPLDYLLKLCCKNPRLISEHLDTECSSGCRRKHFLNDDQEKCERNCMYVESGLEVGGKINFEVATKMLTDNSENPDKWKPAIKKAVSECEKAKEFEYCVRSSLMKNCADLKGESFCASIERYMKKCS